MAHREGNGTETRKISTGGEKRKERGRIGGDEWRSGRASKIPAER
jgi:hypothetical protein